MKGPLLLRVWVSPKRMLSRTAADFSSGEPAGMPAGAAVRVGVRRLGARGSQPEAILVVQLTAEGCEDQRHSDSRMQRIAVLPQRSLTAWSPVVFECPRRRMTDIAHNLAAPEDGHYAGALTGACVLSGPGDSFGRSEAECSTQAERDLHSRFVPGLAESCTVWTAACSLRLATASLRGLGGLILCAHRTTLRRILFWRKTAMAQVSGSADRRSAEPAGKAHLSGRQTTGASAVRPVGRITNERPRDPPGRPGPTAPSCPTYHMTVA